MRIEEEVEAHAALQNAITYSRATSPIWQIAVYDALHEGRRFANIGGRDLLEFVGDALPLSEQSSVLELCCGVGDTCRYIAERFGCRVTGVEINRRQVEEARATGHPLVTIVEGDVRSFGVGRRFDVVLALDSLSLIPLFEDVVRGAPGDALLISDVLAGPELTAATREFTWDIDAVVNLPRPDEYRDLLARAGFERIDSADLTAMAVSAFSTIAEELAKHEEELVTMCGRADVDEWRDVVARYTSAFTRRELLYGRLLARRL